MPDPVLAERRDAVLLLTLNRPDRLNAWSDELEARYFQHLVEAEADPEVRAIVVTGAGRAFCSGADLDDLAAAAADLDKSVFERSPPRKFPLTLRKPLIAALNGAAVGLGLVEALYCDIRFAVPEAKLTTTFARRGLIAEYGMSWLLPRLIGTSKALDLLLSGRFVRGEEALAMGLVDRLCDPDLLVEEAVAYANELATLSSPTSMAIIKRQVFDDLDRDFDAAFAASDRMLPESFDRPDVKEGVDSFVEKRTPNFKPLSTPS